MKTLKVKSCPFCGGEVEASNGIFRVPIWFFKCKNKDCGATMSFNCDRTNDNPDEAFELYNRRIEK